MIVEGQLEGGAMQAVGWALREDMLPYGTGAEQESEDFNPNFRPINISDYAIATTLDAPEIYGAIIETNEGEGPFGAKAAGEICANSGARPLLMPFMMQLVSGLQISRQLLRKFFSC